MPQEITIPRLGWSMEEATFSSWHKSDGDLVAAGDALFTLESDKATQDIDAIDGGVLRWLPDSPKAGDLVRVGQCVGYLTVPGESWPPGPATAAANQSTAVTLPTQSIVQEAHPNSIEDSRDATAPAIPAAGSAPNSQSNVSTPTSIPAPRISPRALRAANDLGVDWRGLRGTGRTGRIRERDVRLAASSSSGPSSTLRATATSSLRPKIADRLVASLRDSAPVTLHTTVDATQLVAWRDHLKSNPGSPGNPTPSYSDLLVHLTAKALAIHPVLNARWEDSGLNVFQNIHIGIAVDTEVGLLVPVVRNVPSLDLPTLARTTQDLIQRTRARKLAPDEMRGGTFTLTNLGAFGIDAFTPILNAPECGILGIGRIQRRPAVVNDQILPRDQMTLSLTFDHRALDGAPAARFLQTVARLIETAFPS